MHVLRKAWNWSKARRTLLLLMLTYSAGLIILTVAITLTASHKHTTSTTPSTESARTNFTIASQPSGISFTAIGDCNDRKTPFTCSLSRNAQTTLVAPDPYSVANKTYTFQYWQNCPKPYPDLKACLVYGTRSATVTAVYAEGTTPPPTTKNTPSSRSSSSNPKGSSGPCGPAVPRTANGNVYCDLTITATQVPVEIRMLTPEGSPGFSVSCSVSNACYEYSDFSTGQKTYFTSKTYTNIFSFEIDNPTQVTIAVPVTRSQEQSMNGKLGTMTFTSSYWVYGPGQGTRCCGTNPPLIYDIYNGYTQSFKPYD